ncbi:ROK family protein [Alloscardovia venturai]|uniref:ROK family protein n=1 Tax=Alloscardovia venturai TaxID=1769421 RepID=A0ABW2Y2S4_9BIFI
MISSFKIAFDCPILIDNDANSAAIAESRQGAGQGCSNFLYIQTGDGTGSALVVNGSLYRGSLGLAGEIGHQQVDPLGDICSCGNRGCLNTVINEERLTSVLQVTHGSMSYADLIQGCIDGDPGCRRVISDAAIRIGTVVASSCIAVDPGKIIVGGLLSKSGDIFIEPFRESIQRLLFPSAVTPIEVIASPIPEKNVPLGAALSAIENSKLELAK